MAAEDEKVELNLAGQRLSAQGTNVVILLMLLVVAVTAVSQYFHIQDVKDSTAEIIRSNKAVASALSDLVRASRFSACITATDPDKRAAEYMAPNSYCNRTQ